MPSKVVRIRDRNQVTLPPEVLKTASLNEGDFLEVSVTSESTVVLKPKRLVAWNTHEEAVLADGSAEEDIAQKRYRTFANAHEFSENLVWADAAAPESAGGGLPKTEADIVDLVAAQTGLKRKVV